MFVSDELICAIAHVIAIHQFVRDFLKSSDINHPSAFFFAQESLAQTMKDMSSLLNAFRILTFPRLSLCSNQKTCISIRQRIWRYSFAHRFGDFCCLKSRGIKLHGFHFFWTVCIFGQSFVRSFFDIVIFFVLVSFFLHAIHILFCMFIKRPNMLEN